MNAALILAAYAARLACVLFAAFGLGAFASPRKLSLDTSPSVRQLLRFAHGLGVLGLIALCLALTGQLASTTLCVTLAIAFVLGLGRLLRGLRAWSPRFCMPSRTCRGKLSFHHWFLAAICAGHAANAIIGALAPDAQQDSLWYHLSCARAWLHWHKPYAWPSVYPSSYHLHGSMLYTFALAVGDEIDCSLLYAACGFLAFLSVSLFAKRWFGGRAALWSWFLCATAYATHVWYVPINTGSDLIAAMFACCGGLTLLDLLGRGELLRARPKLFMAGWLLGWGVVTKLTVLGYIILPLAVFFLASSLGASRCKLGHLDTLKSGLSEVVGEWLAFFVPLLTPFLLWSVRSLVFGAGNPFYPLFRDVLPLYPEFDVTRRNLSVNTLYPFSPDGFALMFSSFPRKLEYLITARSPAFLLHAAATLVGLTSRHRLWRLMGLLGSCQWGVFLWSAGYNETVKYFSICFPMHFVFVGALLVRFEDTTHVSKSLKWLSLLAFAGLLAYVYVSRQVEWGNFETVSWRYRPVLRREERLAYLRSKACQLNNIDLYTEANRRLPADAVVLFPDNAYPFYVDRRYLWTDEDLDFFQYLENLGVRDETDLRLYFADHHVTHVLANPQNIAARPIWRGLLVDMDLSTSSAAARLFTVR